MNIVAQFYGRIVFATEVTNFFQALFVFGKKQVLHDSSSLLVHFYSAMLRRAQLCHSKSVSPSVCDVEV